MAKLTFAQKAEIANSLSFQKRLVSAVKELAEYWKNFTFTQLSEYTEDRRKQKEYGKQILNGAAIPNPQAWAEFLLNIYNENTPDLDGNGELSDAVISKDGIYMPVVYAYFAGVQAGDNSKSIQF